MDFPQNSSFLALASFTCHVSFSFGQAKVLVHLAKLKSSSFLVLCQRIHGVHKSYDIHYENSAGAEGKREGIKQRL